MTTLAFRVHGTPAPQGSKTRTRYGMRDDNAERLRPWREAVKQAALDVAPPAPLTGPVNVTAAFYFARPKGHYGTGRNSQRLKASAPALPTGKPDIDKVQRSCFDAITDAGIWLDDAQVATVTAAKLYADPYAGVHPGADITITPLGDQP